MRISRREFVKSATASGIVLSMSRLAIAEEPGFAARETLPGRQGWNPAATGVGRIDGVVKVTGAKLYASDFRAADLPNWPPTTSHAMLVRAPGATHVYTGLDLSPLSGALKPSVVVTAADLARTRMRVPEFYAGDLLCPVGKTPLYLGQPVALLIFEDFDTFDQARLALRDAAVVKFGAETGPVKMTNYGQFRFTRVGGPSPDAPDVYSPVKNGWVSPGVFESSDARSGHGSRSQPGKPMPKPRPMAKRSARNLLRTIRHFWCWTANSRRSRSTRWLSSRKAALPGMTPAARTSSSLSACSRPTKPRARSHICSATPRRPSNRLASTPILPIAAADSADATTRRFPFTRRWRRCSSRIVRSGLRTTASSSFNRGSSGTRSRSARG